MKTTKCTALRTKAGWLKDQSDGKVTLLYVAICSVLCQEGKLVLGQYISFKLVSGNQIQDKQYNIFPTISNL